MIVFLLIFVSDFNLMFFVVSLRFNLWSNISKCWSHANKPVLVPQSNIYKSWTVYGIIGSCFRRNGFFMVARSTNAEDFVKFLELADKKILARFRGTKPILVLDNASAHCSIKKGSLAALLKYFTPLNTPSYSCRFNSIEHLWGYSKHALKCLMINQQADNDMTPEEFRIYLDQYFKKLDSAVVGRFITANRRSLIEEL